MAYHQVTPIVARDVKASTYNKRSKRSSYHHQTLRVAHPITKFKQRLGNLAPPGLYMPVYRVSSLYHAHNPEYCGKFYFYEPDSNVHLSLGRTKFCANKIDAYAKLYSEYAHIMPTETIEEFGQEILVLEDPPFERYKGREKTGLAQMARMIAYLMRSSFDGNYLPDVVLIVLAFYPWKLKQRLFGLNDFTPHYNDVYDKIQYIYDHFLRILPNEQSKDKHEPQQVLYEDAVTVGVTRIPTGTFTSNPVSVSVIPIG